MKFIVGSNWNGWDNKENIKGKEVDLTKEQEEHLKSANVKLIPVNEPAKGK